MKKLSTSDCIVLLLITSLVAAIIAPAVAKIQRTPADATCQANLRLWTRAMALYADDFQGRYPTNRRLNGTSISNLIPLSPPNMLDADGNPVRFVSGVNWVEALFPYLQTIAGKTGRGWLQALKCANALNQTYPNGSTTARVSYIFNINLCENLSALVRDSQKVMMLRESDRLLDATLRPTMVTIQSPSPVPISPFLSTTDTFIGPVEPNRHAEGSYIAFADGHVSYFTADYFPATLSSAKSWDPATAKWYNYGPGSKGQVPDSYINSIAISP